MEQANTVTPTMSVMQRPWQGTALGVLNIISVVFSFLFGLAFLFMQGIITSVFESGNVQVEGMESVGASGMMSLLAGFTIAFGVVLLGIGILEIFMARGAFKGQKWSPIVSIVFAVLAILNGFTDFQTTTLVSLAISAFALYVAIVCVKHPYYNSKA